MRTIFIFLNLSLLTVMGCKGSFNLSEEFSSPRSMPGSYCAGSTLKRIGSNGGIFIFRSRAACEKGREQLHRTGAFFCSQESLFHLNFLNAPVTRPQNAYIQLRSADACDLAIDQIAGSNGYFCHHDSLKHIEAPDVSLDIKRSVQACHGALEDLKKTAGQFYCQSQTIIDLLGNQTFQKRSNETCRQGIEDLGRSGNRYFCHDDHLIASPNVGFDFKGFDSLGSRKRCREAIQEIASTDSFYCYRSDLRDVRLANLAPRFNGRQYLTHHILRSENECLRSIYQIGKTQTYCYAASLFHISNSGRPIETLRSADRCLELAGGSPSHLDEGGPSNNPINSQPRPVSTATPEPAMPQSRPLSTETPQADANPNSVEVKQVPSLQSPISINNLSCTHSRLVDSSSNENIERFHSSSACQKGLSQIKQTGEVYCRSLNLNSILDGHQIARFSSSSACDQAISQIVETSGAYCRGSRLGSLQSRNEESLSSQAACRTAIEEIKSTGGFYCRGNNLQNIRFVERFSSFSSRSLCSQALEEIRSHGRYCRGNSLMSTTSPSETLQRYNSANACRNSL